MKNPIKLEEGVSVPRMPDDGTDGAASPASPEAKETASSEAPITENATVEKMSKRKPPTRSKNLDMRPREYLTEEEVETLMLVARKTTRNPVRDSTMILLAFRHGLRVTELCDLEWNQIDFDAGRIDIVRIKNGYSSPHPLLGDELRLLRQIYRGKVASPYLFNSERGAPLATGSFRKMLARVAKKTDLEISVHPHMLRHGCGFKLANDGVDTRVIQDYLGHKNIQHTVTYTKLSMDRFNGLWKGK